MEDIKMEDIVEPTSPSEVIVEKEADPLQDELDKVRQKEGGRTKLEKLIYTKNRVDQQIRELGGEEDVTPEPEEDDKPLTRGEFKKLQQDQATKTALDLADTIDSETERELTKYHLNNSIKSTGNPAEDLKLARAIVNASKNSKILEEVQRKGEAKTFSSASGVNANQEDREAELTPFELELMNNPQFKLTKGDILKARKGEGYKFTKNPIPKLPQ